jgi:hypothetical protein
MKMDHSFHELDRDLRQTKKGEPVYGVTATLAGRFDSAPVTACGDGTQLCPSQGGFGHFGAYGARLVIESVSDVAALKRSKP